MAKFVLGFVTIVAIVGFLVLYISRNTEKKDTTHTLQVAASFYPHYFFASQIGGDKATVYNITPAGTEPHDYEPSTKDIARVENSKMLVLNGRVEPWANNIKDNLQNKDILFVTAGEGLMTIKADPHIWLSPVLAKKEVEKITKGFIQVDPPNKDYYIDNETVLEKRLDELDNKYKQGLQNCKTHTIVTSHAAFGYLANAYGLEQKAISGISPDEEPSSKTLAGIANYVKDNNIRYIFFESLVSPKLAQTLAGETGTQTLVLDPIEGLSDDTIKQGKNYFTLMESNLKNLQKALGCTTKNTP